MPSTQERFDCCDARAKAKEWVAFPAEVGHWESDANDLFARRLARMWQMPDAADEVCIVEIEKSLEDRFREQSDKWARETGHMSSPTQKIMHPSYQAILGMGREHRTEVIRLLLRDLQQYRRQWFWALSYVAQDNPIQREDAGNIDKMIGAWSKWGKEKGLL